MGEIHSTQEYYSYSHRFSPYSEFSREREKMKKMKISGKKERRVSGEEDTAGLTLTGSVGSSVDHAVSPNSGPMTLGVKTYPYPYSLLHIESVQFIILSKHILYFTCESIIFESDVRLQYIYIY